MKNRNKAIGNKGEELAAAFLKKQGYIIHTLNYFCRFGEIDVIAEKDDEIVFVEVKTRVKGGFGRPADYVDTFKQHKIITTAEYYIYNNYLDLQPRFDVVEILTLSVGVFDGCEINHIVNAFNK